MNTTPTEAMEQTALFEWARLSVKRYPELSLMYHIGNGGSRHPAEAMHLKQQGVKPGVPDICLPVPRGIYSALYIELKRQKGGRVSDDQRAWISALNRAGNRAVICHGWEDARNQIMDYLQKSEGAL